MAAAAVTKLEATLRRAIQVFPTERRIALVGGLAVSARTEPRFTRDIDLAVVTRDDADAEQVVHAMQQLGFSVIATVEHQTTHRLMTARLRASARDPFVDLLFSSCGIEAEIVDAATTLEVSGASVPVATVGHLIAMKLVSRDDVRRPRDWQDLVNLAAVADDGEWARARAAVELVTERGFARERNLREALDALARDHR